MSMLQGLKTTGVQIKNRRFPDNDSSLSVAIKRKVIPQNDNECSAFLCKFQAVITEKDALENNNDFSVSVEVVALLKYEIPNTAFSEIQDLALQEIYPHLRAIISSVTAAIGMHSILIPLNI